MSHEPLTLTAARIQLASVAIGVAMTAGCFAAPEEAQDSPTAQGQQNALDQEDALDDAALAAARPSASRCYTTRGGVILPVDLKAEKLGQSIGSFDTSQGWDASSLGVIGKSLLTCSNRQIQVVDLESGKREHIARDCSGATSDGRRIWVNSPFERTLNEYRGLQALRDNTVRRTLPSVHASRLGRGEDRILAAWHSAAEVLAVDRRTGATTAIPLPNYDGWIFGLTEVGDKRYVVGGWVERGIRVYDRTSGALTATLFPNEFFQVLACAP